eukprot:scaffold289397_cov30-Tisochrysis_lutea.AAC.3
MRARADELLSSPGRTSSPRVAILLLPDRGVVAVEAAAAPCCPSISRERPSRCRCRCECGPHRTTRPVARGMCRQPHTHAQQHQHPPCRPPSPGRGGGSSTQRQRSTTTATATATATAHQPQPQPASCQRRGRSIGH